MRGWVLLASYPKSGNTWLRAFLTNLLSERPGPASIQDLVGRNFAVSRRVFEDHTGLDSGDLTAAEVERLRPGVLRQAAANPEGDGPHFLKVHDAWSRVADDEELFPAAATRSVIYIVRNPLDIAPSFANHAGYSEDRVIELMGSSETCLGRGERELPSQLRAKLGTWGEHVESWLDRSGLPVHLVRYEDMKERPAETFGGIVHYLGLGTETSRIRQAISSCSFSELQRQEVENGFQESPEGVKFFWRGEVGTGTRLLSEAQTDRILADHARVMARLGYLDADPDGPVP